MKSLSSHTHRDRSRLVGARGWGGDKEFSGTEFWFCKVRSCMTM